MRLSAVVVVFAAASMLCAAQAQVACPNPDNLLGNALSAEEFYAAVAGPDVSKGEFETSAEYQARVDAVARPPSALIRVHTEPSNFVYDADAEVFKFSVYNLEPSRLYKSAVPLKQGGPDLKDTLGDYTHPNPVDMQIKSVEANRREYTATNAYGAETIVTAVSKTDFIVFDRKGRSDYTNGDDLFSERKRSEMTKLSIPVARSLAPMTKANLEVVAYLLPKAPWAGETYDRMRPTRDRPIDLSTTFKIVFADIQCVGVRNHNGELLAHWATR